MLGLAARVRSIALWVVVGVALGMLGVAVAIPAQAVAGTLTVTTLDRTGHAVRTQYGVVAVPTGRQYYFMTGRAHQLPVGAYDVFAAIPTAGQGADTVGVRRVHVSGFAHVTIDARNGRAVRGRMQPAPPDGFTERTVAVLCSATGSPIVGGGTFGGPAYVIASSLPEVQFAFSSVWSSQDPDHHGATYYAGAALHRHGAPAGMMRTFRQSSLTQLSVRGRTGLQSGEAEVDVRYAAPSPCRSVTLQLFPTATLPYTLTMHLPAGRWALGQFAQDSLYGPGRRYLAGRSYLRKIGTAVWGPDSGLPVVDQYCHCLTGTDTPMFADPALPSGASAHVTYLLKHRGTTIAQKTIDPDRGYFSPKLPATGWYSLVEVATRNPINPLPGDVLSTRSTLRLHFYADRDRHMQVGGFLTRFLPRGLTIANRARTKTTTVVLKPLRSRGPGPDQDVVKNVRLWMSTDSGHTWQVVPVRHVSGGWSATLTNPSAGFVSLRATVRDALGATATTQVIRAYAVS